MADFLAVLGLFAFMDVLLLCVAGAVLFLYALFTLGPLPSRGEIGEQRIQRRLARSLDKNTYRVFHNVLLPVEGGTTQIDHVVLSPFGIFAIETKNMGGAIYGSERDHQWTQKIGRQTHKFQNPLRQNHGHRCALAVCLGVPAEQVHSIVAFVGSARLAKGPLPGVVRGTLACVQEIRRHRAPVFEPERVAELAAALEMGRIQATREAMRDHTRRVQEARAAAPIDSQPVCPKCGGRMVLRTARQGANAGRQFWGCGRFPQCRGRRDIA